MLRGTMRDWLPIIIAAAALVYTIVANGFERGQRKKEFELVRTQARAVSEERAERRRAYVSVEPGDKRGGDGSDEHDFVVTNAGPALARHVSVRVERSDGAALTAAAKVNPHILEVADSGRTTIAVPRAERMSDLRVVVEWVDPEQQQEWALTQRRKERVVGPLEPVSRNP